jgi:O-antigen ligase
VTGLETLASVGAAIVAALIVARPPLGLLALIVYTPLLDAAPRLPIPGLNVETGLFFLLLAMTVFRFGPRLPPLRYSGPVIAYVLVLVVSWLVGAASFHVEGKDTWELFKVVKSMSFPCLLFVFTYWWVSDEARRRQVLEALLWSGTLAAIGGAIDYVAPFTVNGMAGRASGFLYDPNSLGGFLAATTLVFPILARDPGLGPLRRAVHAGQYAFGLLVLVLSLSRAGWLGVLAGHAALLLFLSPRLLFVFAVSAVLLLPPAYPFFPKLIRNRIEESLRPRSTVYAGSGAERLGSGADRVVYYRIGATMLAESPIWGHGLGSFLVLTPKYGARYGLVSHRAAHSVIVKLAAESGLIGLAMLGWLGLTVAVLCWRLRGGRGQDAALGIALAAILSSISVSNLFQVTFVADHAVAGLLWIALGSAARAFSDRRHDSRLARAPTGWRARVLEASTAQASARGLAARSASTPS